MKTERSANLTFLLLLKIGSDVKTFDKQATKRNKFDVIFHFLYMTSRRCHDESTMMRVVRVALLRIYFELFPEISLSVENLSGFQGVLRLVSNFFQIPTRFSSNFVHLCAWVGNSHAIKIPENKSCFRPDVWSQLLIYTQYHKRSVWGVLKKKNITTIFFILFIFWYNNFTCCWCQCDAVNVPSKLKHDNKRSYFKCNRFRVFSHCHAKWSLDYFEDVFFENEGSNQRNTAGKHVLPFRPINLKCLKRSLQKHKHDVIVFIRKLNPPAKLWKVYNKNTEVERLISDPVVPFWFFQRDVYTTSRWV